MEWLRRRGLPSPLTPRWFLPLSEELRVPTVPLCRPEVTRSEGRGAVGERNRAGAAGAAVFDPAEPPDPTWWSVTHQQAAIQSASSRSRSRAGAGSSARREQPEDTTECDFVEVARDEDAVSLGWRPRLRGVGHPRHIRRSADRGRGLSNRSSGGRSTCVDSETSASEDSTRSTASGIQM